MLKRNTATTSALSPFLLVTLCLLFSITSQAQTPDTARLDGRIDTLNVQLARASGTERPGERLQGQISDISKRNGKFDLGVLPAGRYELRIKLYVDSNGDGTVTQNGGKMQDDTWMKNVKVTLEGVQGGPIIKDLALSSPEPDTSQSNAKGIGDLRNQIGGLSSGQQMRTRSQTIPFTSDGKRVVSGKLGSFAKGVA